MKDSHSRNNGGLFAEEILRFACSVENSCPSFAPLGLSRYGAATFQGLTPLANDLPPLWGYGETGFSTEHASLRMTVWGQVLVTCSYAAKESG